MQAHFDPAREADPYALPDCEVFYVDGLEDENGEALEAGWYWRPCFPGCLPDGDAIGPFATEAEALEDAQDDY